MVSAAFYLGTKLQQLSSGLKQTDEKVDKLDKKFDTKFDEVNKKFDEVNKKFDLFLDMWARSPYALASVVAGLREAAAGGPVRAFVAASHNDVAAWLKAEGFEQYVPKLAALDGLMLLQQTQAILEHMGMQQHRAKLLLEKITIQAYKTPQQPQPQEGKAVRG